MSPFLHCVRVCAPSYVSFLGHCVCVCECVCACVCACMHDQVCVGIHACMRVCVCAYVCMPVSARLCAGVHALSVMFKIKCSVSVVTWCVHVLTTMCTANCPPTTCSSLRCIK